MNTFDEITANYKNLSNTLLEIRSNYENCKKDIMSKARRFRIYLAICLAFFSIILGAIIGCTLYKHEVKGLHTVCYTTATGNCYHSAGCGYLRSSYKTNVYVAKNDGYTACSRCSVGELDISDKNEVAYGVLTMLGISVIIFFWASIKRRKVTTANISRIKAISEEKSELAESEFDAYLINKIETNGMLQIVDAPEHIQIMNGKLYSTKENIYRYISYYGECYHISKKCLRGRFKEVLVFDVIGKYHPCGKCNSFYSDSKPEWYIKYEKINLMLKRSKTHDYR